MEPELKPGLSGLFMAFILCVIVSACTQTTAQPLDERSAIITTRGNVFDEANQVYQEALIEAAQLTAERGFGYFVIMSTQNQTRKKKPGVSLVVQMFREGEVDPTKPGVWSAESVLAANKAT